MELHRRYALGCCKSVQSHLTPRSRLQLHIPRDSTSAQLRSCHLPLKPVRTTDAVFRRKINAVASHASSDRRNTFQRRRPMTLSFTARRRCMTVTPTQDSIFDDHSSYTIDTLLYVICMYLCLKPTSSELRLRNMWQKSPAYGAGDWK